MPQRQPRCAAADPPSLARCRQRRRALWQARDCVAPPLAGKDPHLSQGRPAAGCQFSKDSDFCFFIPAFSNAGGQRRFLFSNRAPGDDGAARHVARSRVAEKCRPGPVCRQLQQYRGGPVPCSPGAPLCRCAAIPPLAALTCQARARGVPHGARVEGPPPPTLSSGGSARESEGSCRSLCTQPRRSWPDYLRCASPAAWPS